MKKIEILATKVQEKYGNIVTIIMIIQLIAALVQIYKACKKEKEIDDLDNLSVIDKMIAKRVIKKQFPNLSTKERNHILDTLVETSKENKEVVNAFMADANS